jgi:hypothetical protein
VLKHRIERIAHHIARIALDQRLRFHIAAARQQPSEMCPHETLQRRVRVMLFVRKMMVPPMHRDPKSGRELQ